MLFPPTQDIVSGLRADWQRGALERPVRAMRLPPLPIRATLSSRETSPPELPQIFGISTICLHSGSLNASTCPGWVGSWGQWEPENKERP